MRSICSSISSCCVLSSFTCVCSSIPASVDVSLSKTAASCSRSVPAFFESGGTMNMMITSSGDPGARGGSG